ncbi:mas-related G-protein coupled receptor member H-like [Thamnophis elegans]|uniref:mas-related G-protein coupled receptor member H-like n=1 Tax=Thamnophis elegans TaxID=35005 RepID=UPI0013772DEC|nr:mas-related G-protein coupled receptor member H-like [Thamnophis elegans]
MDMTSILPLDYSAEKQATSNCTNIRYDASTNTERIIFAIFTMLFCVLGMLGNGLVIWLLGSSIKRNTFAIYIINLSVADFGFLTFEMIIEIHGLPTNSYCGFPYEYFQTVVLLMHSTGQFLLTVISIDRCLSVLFPIWYRCHRPVQMFTNVCAVIWVISFILSSINLIIVALGEDKKTYVLIYPFIINTVLCFPLMTISSVILLIKICFISKRQRRRKLLTAILLTLFFFLALAFPLNVFYFNLYFSKGKLFNHVHYGNLCLCINSSINPLIYYLVGRQKGETQRSIKELLQIVFKEEENCSDQTETSEGSKI